MNVIRVGHNPVEFVMEFGQCFARAPEQFHTRLVTSPTYAREFLRVLQKSVADFEREFGPIASGKS